MIPFLIFFGAVAATGFIAKKLIIDTHQWEEPPPYYTETAYVVNELWMIAKRAHPGQLLNMWIGLHLAGNQEHTVEVRMTGTGLNVGMPPSALGAPLGANTYVLRVPFHMAEVAPGVYEYLITVSIDDRVDEFSTTLEVV